MKYGVILPNVGPLAHIDSLARIAQNVEHLGYDGVFLSDHIAIPSDLRSAYPYRSDGRFPLTTSDRILEPVTTLAYLAAVTSRLQLGFSVLVLPYRHPVLNAKMLGTLDVISNGRLIVGAGVGWMAEEFAALDSDFESRGAVTDEHIALLKAFWTNPEPNVRGTHYSVAGVGMAPSPVSKPHPPIWTGGISPPALRRAATIADGWHGVRQSPADVARVAAQIGDLRASRDVSIEGFTMSLRAGLDITDEPFDGTGRAPLRGSPDQVAADLSEYYRAGLDYLVVEPRATTPGQMIDQLERFTALDRP